MVETISGRDVRPRAVHLWRADAGAVASLLLLVLVYFGGYAFLGVTVYENDLEDYHRPILAFIGEAIRTGSQPAWTSEVGAGYPFLADGTAGFFHPLTWLAAIVPADWAILALLGVRTGLSAIFLYAFARASRISPAGAWLAAITYAFSGFSVGHWVHLNISLAAMTLPLGLLGVEKASSTRGRAALPWLMLVGSALGLQWLASHPQVALLSSACLLLFGAFRCLTVGGSIGTGGRLLRLAVGGLVAGATAAGIGAVQIIPMFELLAHSPRSGGLSYDAASLFPLPPHGLLTLLWPLAFYSPSGFDWGLSVRWETALYVGQLPLILAALALVHRRDGSALFWAVLAILGIWVALGPYAPVNLHWWIAQLPGANLFRVPGRFLLFTCLGLAILAGRGWDSFRSGGQRERWRAVVAATALAAITVAGWVAGWIASSAGVIGPGALEAAYTSWPHSSTWPSDKLLAAARETLAPGSARLVVPATLSILVAGLLVGSRRRPQWPGWPSVTCAVVALDLMLFAGQFWQLATPERAFSGVRSSIATYLVGQGGGGRLLSLPDSPTFANQMLGTGVPEVNFYSQLLPRRYGAYLGTAAGGGNRLLDLLGVRWIAAPDSERALPSHHGVTFDPRKPLARVSRRDATAQPNSDFAFAPARRTAGVRIVGALQYAAHVEQGRTVAELVLKTESDGTVTLPLRAGIEVAETAAERSDVAPQLRHSPATAIHRDRTVHGKNEVYDNLLYFADIALGRTTSVTAASVRIVDPGVDLYVYGLGLVSPEGQVARTDEYSRPGMREVLSEEGGRLIENGNALPRAFLAGAAKPLVDDSSALARLAKELVDPLAVVYLEDVPDLSAWKTPGPAGEVRIVDAGDTRLRLEAEAERPALLVLTDLWYPGWQVTVDGQPAPAYRADYVFRAVPIPAGRHEVVFTFVPYPLIAGAVITITTVVAILIAALLLWNRGGPQVPDPP